VTFTIETDYKYVEFFVTANLSTSGQLANLLKFQPSGNVFTATVNMFRCNDTSNQTLTVDVKSTTKEASMPATTKSILSNVASLLDNHEFSDFKFIINDKEFNVHKNILAAASDSFAKIFRVNEKFWKISDVDEEAFGHLLRFIYTGKAPENLDEIAIKLFEAASCFKINDLKEMCMKKIHLKLALGNALETYNWAYIYDLEVLKAKAWELVKR
jgi:BTB/POZ domain